MPFPASFIDKNYNLDYAKHFYSKKEIQTFKSKWKTNINTGQSNITL